jgi:hypothetical protein
MNHKEDDTLEELVEQFKYNLQRTRKKKLNDEMKKIIFLREIKDELIEVLNLMGEGVVSMLDYNDLCYLFHKYSRGNERIGKFSRDVISIFSRQAMRDGVTKEEIDNMFENFKTIVLAH